MSTDPIHGTAKDRLFRDPRMLEPEAFFRNLTALSSDWYWLQDHEFKFTRMYLSAEAEALARHGPDAWTGRRRWEIPGITPLSSTWEEHKAVLEAHEPFRNFEYKRVDPDGFERFLSISGAPFYDKAGRFAGYQGVGHDITERKRIENALRESETRFRSLAALSSDWYWRQDSELRFTYLSSEVEALAGYSAESSLGKRRWELKNVFPESGSWDEHRADVDARRAFRDFEYRRIEASGGDRFISVSGEPVFDNVGRFVGYQGVARNITEQRRIENELRGRQEMLNLAQQVASAAAFDWHAGSRRTSRIWSKELVMLHAGRDQEMPATWRSFRRWIAIEDRARVGDELKRAAQGGELSLEYRVAPKDGQTRWLQAKGRLFSNARGRPVRLVGYVLDITQRKQAEDGVRQLERLLRRSHRLQAIGTLAGGIAHDFNNILGRPRRRSARW